MSPEQIGGEPDKIGKAADIYSLGVILYETLTGRLPFLGPTMAILGQILTQDPEPPSKIRSDLDPELERICQKAMAKKPEERFTSMREFAEALGKYQEHAAPTRSPATGAMKPVRKTRKMPKKAFLGTWPGWAWPAATAAVLVLLGAVILLQTDQGLVKIDVTDPRIQVSVDGKEVTIDRLQNPLPLKPGEHSLAIQIGGAKLNAGQTIKLQAADHRLLVKLGELELRSNSFQVVKGDNPVLRIELIPARGTAGLKTPPTDPKPPVIEVQKRGQLLIKLEGSAPGLAIRLDSKALNPKDLTQPLEVAEGPHTLELEATGLKPLKQNIPARAGLRVTVVVKVGPGGFGLGVGGGPIPGENEQGWIPREADSYQSLSLAGSKLPGK
jgi:hypothetical protein